MPSLSHEQSSTQNTNNDKNQHHQTTFTLQQLALIARNPPCISLREMPSLEESVLEEEALIRAYQAELAILKQHSSTLPAAAGEETNDIDHNIHEDDLLESMFPLPSRGAPSLKLVASDSSSIINKQECLELTQSIQGFVFSSVESETHPTATREKDPNQPLAMYLFRGHFVANPSVSACIRMTVEINRKNTKAVVGLQSHHSSQKRRRVSASRVNRVVSLECSLSSSKGDDLSHIEASMSPSSSNNNTKPTTTHNNSLPDWIQRVSVYLEFDKRQHNSVLRWNRTYGHEYHCSHRTSKTSHSVWIQPKENTSNAPTFIWEWDWVQEKDSVQLVVGTEITASGGDVDDLSPKGLQDLVTCVGSCEKALDVILQTLSSR